MLIQRQVSLISFKDFFLHRLNLRRFSFFLRLWLKLKQHWEFFWDWLKLNLAALRAQCNYLLELQRLWLQTSFSIDEHVVTTTYMEQLMAVTSIYHYNKNNYKLTYICLLHYLWILNGSRILKEVTREQKSFTIIIYEFNLLHAYFFHTSTKAACLYPIDFYSAEIECRCI